MVQNYSRRKPVVINVLINKKKYLEINSLEITQEVRNVQPKEVIKSSYKHQSSL